MTTIMKLKVTPSKGRQPEKMPVQRHALILDYIRRRGVASIHELANAIGASVSTIRRDLDRLEARRVLQRTHGGAVLPAEPHATFEPASDLAAQLARAEKRMIGAAAVEALKPGESVIFDSSSTVFCAAQAAIARAIPLTAVTNDLAIAQILAQSELIHVLVAGGTVRRGSLTLTGDPGRSFLATLHADVAFLGTHTISGRLVTDTSVEVVSMKREMIKAARRVVLLADSSKFQLPAFCTITDLSEVDELITDERADPVLLQSAREIGIGVTVVRVNRSQTSDDNNPATI